MDDLSFAARRASSSAPRSDSDPEARFRAMVQSPLRAGILRFLSARPSEQFDAEAIMQAFGRMRLDVENCLKELVESGVVRRVAGEPLAYTAARLDAASALGKLLDTFLERRAAVGIEDTSPSVQRFRELIGRDEDLARRRHVLIGIQQNAWRSRFRKRIHRRRNQCRLYGANERSILRHIARLNVFLQAQRGNCPRSLAGEHSVAVQSHCG